MKYYHTIHLILYGLSIDVDVTKKHMGVIL